jgi:hypothetical protein
VSFRESRRLYQRLDVFIKESAVAASLGYQSALQERASTLRGLLQDINPFLLTLSPKESRARLEKLLDALHDSKHPLKQYQTEIFPPRLSSHPVGNCGVPYCNRSGCDPRRERWAEIVGLVAAFSGEEGNWPGYGDHFGAECRSHLPDKEVKRIEEGK